MTRISGSVLHRSLLAAGAALLAVAALAPTAVADDQSQSANAVRWVHARGGDGALGFDSSGHVVALDTRGHSVPIGTPGGGLSITDPASGSTAEVSGKLHRAGTGVRQSTIVPAMGARVDVTYEPGPSGTIVVSGAVEDLRGTDRAIDTEFALPLAVSSAKWDKDLVDPEPFGVGSKVESQVGLPLAAVRGAEDGFALAYAIEPKDPSHFEIGVHTDSSAPTFFIRQLWGLSPAATGRLHSRAPFRFTIDLGVDPHWGFRSALQRYYDRSPGMFADRAGMTSCGRSHPSGARESAYGTWQYLPRSLYQRPKSLAYHMSGINKDGATTVGQLAANEEWDADQANCVATLPYTIPGQSEITELPEQPSNYDEAMEALAQWQHDPVPFGSANGPNSYRSTAEQKALIANSGIYDPDGRYQLLNRTTDWGGHSVTFPTDPNPRLFAGTDKITTAKYMLDYYVPMMLADPRVDGIFSDSLFYWGRYFDYRRDHFPAARIPLTYSPVSNAFGTAFVPGISNDFSGLEYLWELRRRLHAQGKVLMTNGMKNQSGESRSFDGFASDVIGTETFLKDLLANDQVYTSLRATAGRKPVMNITHQGWNGVDAWSDRASVDKVWKRGLLYGVAPSSTGGDDLETISQPMPVTQDRAHMTAIELEYQDRYMPALRRIAAAGWKAITGVQSSSPDVRIERYGDPSHFYLVIYNEGDAQTVTFDVDRRVLPGIASGRAQDVLSNGPAPADLRRALAGDGSAALAANSISVLEFKR